MSRGVSRLEVARERMRYSFIMLKAHMEDSLLPFCSVYLLGKASSNSLSPLVAKCGQSSSSM
jgi:hypothetical protein